MTPTAPRGPALTLTLALGCAVPAPGGSDGSEGGTSTAEPTSGGADTDGEPTTTGTSDADTGTSDASAGGSTSTDGPEDATSTTGDPGPTLGDPIDIGPDQLETWVWVPIEGMRCADGSSSGIMVNFTAQSRDLLINFQGGGACWNELTCAVQGASLAPWGDDPFAVWAADGGPVYSGIFDRADPANPLRGYNYVYIPYCTGDGHIGARVADYGVHHVGYANATAALARIVPTFLDAPQVVVAGFSAGGIGATGNYHQIASAFEDVGLESVVVINDAGPVMRPPFLGNATQDLLRAAWGLDATIDPWCTSCASEGLHAVYREQVELHPGVRSSLICAYEDSVVRLLYGALGSPIELGAATQGLLDFAGWRDEIAGDVEPSLLREFYYPGDRHGATELPFADTPGLLEFLTAQISGDPSWTSVRP